MKIICIGRNYVAHAQELENKVPENPIVFIKPESSILKKGNDFKLPSFSSNIHYECELVLKIGKTGKDIAKENALSYIDEIGLGLDLTARDLQDFQKQKGLPWEIAKAFDNSTVLGDFILFDPLNPLQYTFELLKNKEIVQKGDPQLMVFDFETVLHYVSQFFTLEKGDLIFTGTPSGVGKLEEGDILEGRLLNNFSFNLTIK